MPTLRHSPLEAAHLSAGARMVPFGGWQMPLAYRAGTIAEHEACRSDAVVFDVSHLGTLRVTGAGAYEALQRSFTNDLAKISAGRAQYTHLLDPEDASVLDDIIVWWVQESWFDVMPNASNTERVLSALEELGGELRAEDVTASRAMLAVQGPRARERLATVSEEAAAVGRFRVESVLWQGVECLVAGTGYTGEDGVEIAVPAEAASDLWEALLDAGLLPAGLGARDTLRLEAGLPLHGHELGPGITPLQAGLGWVVSWEKGGFRGRDALERERKMGPERILRGLVAEGRRPPRKGNPVWASGETVGSVTSGNYSPLLERGIALALLRPHLPVGSRVEIEIRGKVVPAQIANLPFHKKGK